MSSEDCEIEVFVQLVDTGYLDAKLLAQSKQDHRVDLVGPMRPEYK